MSKYDLFDEEFIDKVTSKKPYASIDEAKIHTLTHTHTFTKCIQCEFQKKNCFRPMRIRFAIIFQ